MSARTDLPPHFAYQAAYRHLHALLDADADARRRLPSLRRLADELQVSVPTIQYAYALLEREGKVMAVPRSGYFPVAARPQPVWRGENRLDAIYVNARRPGMLALSSDAPALLLSLDHPLRAAERVLAREDARHRPPFPEPFGAQALREALARRHADAPAGWRAADVHIAPDWRGALDTAFDALGLSGCAALVEMPCSWALVRVLQARGIRIVPLPARAHGALDVDAAAALLAREPIRCALLSSGVGVPGGTAPGADQQAALAALLARHGVWLFENDRYGDLYFGSAPSRYRDHADPERLIVYSGFDKLVGGEAPHGYLLSRGDATRTLDRAWLARAFRSAPLRERALARLIETGKLAHHAGRLRHALAERMTRMHALLRAEAADLFEITPPRGGAAFWLPARDAGIDMGQVCDTLLAQRIVIAPGEVFGTDGAFRHCLRLSYTVDWSCDIGAAIRALASAVRAQARAAR